MRHTLNSNIILITEKIIISLLGSEKPSPVIIEKRWIPTTIRDIISERYLYTLTKVIEEKLGQLSNASISLESNYNSYIDITRQGDSFIFVLHNKEIEIPTSSYFFDIWNKTTIQVVSWETLDHTGTIDKNHIKRIALTFDDGPSKKYTNILLDILKKENIHVTFYVLWSRVTEFPDILKREYTEWHEIGNHSYSHTLLTKLDDRMMQDELYKTDQAIYNTIGIYPKTFRPPYGWVNTGILEKVAMPAILWSIDPQDWKTLNINSNIASIKNAKDGDILIMHDIHEASVASVPAIIKKLRDNGFTFVTVSELLSLSETNTEIWKKCSKRGNCK